MSEVIYCKQCGAMIEPDLEIDGYGVRCECAGKEYRNLKTDKSALEAQVEMLEEKGTGMCGVCYDILDDTDKTNHKNKYDDLLRRLKEVYEEIDSHVDGSSIVIAKDLLRSAFPEVLK